MKVAIFFEVLKIILFQDVPVPRRYHHGLLSARFRRSFIMMLWSTAKKIFIFLKHSYDVRELLLLTVLCYWFYLVNMKIFSLFTHLREKSDI
jgi:hypothetical protein